MPKSLLIANRGEIAVRIARTAQDLGVQTVAVYAEDDAASLHTRQADRAVSLGAAGPAAYLDGPAIIALATEAGCDAIHPGYGFLSENAAFAAACQQAGLTFVGPAPPTLEAFGDKAAARALAGQCGVPLLAGTSLPVGLAEARSFFESLGPGAAVMLKAVAGGGGRGMRPVERLADLDDAFARASSEAQAAFGSGEVYVEELLTRARHVEVQIVGDGTGAVSHLWDRECSLQRQRQKVIEIAPAFLLPEAARAGMLAAAVALAAEVNYRGVGTIEFLVDARPGAEPRFAFIEANARLQVEHTVTEAVTGRDLVAIQLQIADGASLDDLGLTQIDVPGPVGMALQARVNLESMTADGTPRPGGGVLSAYEQPSGPGVRVDGFGYAGYATSVRYDPLLAKVIVQARDLAAVTAKARRALSEFKIAGVTTNTGFLQALLASPALVAGELHTRYIEEHAPELISVSSDRPRYFEPAGAGPRRAGAQIDPLDPLALLDLKPGNGAVNGAPDPVPLAPVAPGPAGTVAVPAPMQGMVISVAVAEGDTVLAGQPVAVLEALKMEHVVATEVAGVVREVALTVGDTIFADTPIVFVEPQDLGGRFAGAAPPDPEDIRPDLAEVRRLHVLATDEGRPAATQKRHSQGKRTVRENIEDLCDPGTFIEYGPTVTAWLRSDSREQIEERVVRTAADGMVIGVGQVNGDLVGQQNARCAVVAYDYTVLAGTQGSKNHQKTDRMLRIAQQYKLPVVLYEKAAAAGPAAAQARRSRRETPAASGACPPGPGANWASCPASCPRSASTPATASPGTWSCSARATSSSRPGTARSESAARRSSKAAASGRTRRVRSGRSASRSPTA